MRDLLISIVIVGYNAEEHLSKCLKSIYAQNYKNFEIIFVNNGSNDNTNSLLESYHDVKVINNEENKGFCFANNQGIKIANGEYIFTLNSDVMLDKNCLSELRKAIKDSGVALYSPKIFSGKGATIDSTGLELSRFYRFFDRGSGETDRGQYDKKIDIFGPCAAAALYKREMLEDIKYDGEYFDKDFFFLIEDFDLAWRAKNRGWNAAFVPSAICYHERNSANFNNKSRQYLSFRNRLFFLIKRGNLGVGYFIVFILYDIPRFFYILFSNRYAFKLLYETIKNIPNMLKKRSFFIRHVR